MEKLNITPGKWNYNEDTYKVWSEINRNDNNPIICDTSFTHSIRESERTPNGKLIAEAGTVANETGLTPRELQKQRDELLEACKWAMDQFKTLADMGRYPEFMLANNGGNGITPLVNAINNATK